MTTMLYQGHGSYRLTANDGTTVYVDPFAGEGYDKPADLVLITHEHPDHTKTGLLTYAPGAETIRTADIHPVPGEYLSMESHGIRVTAVQACNDCHPLDDCVGLVIQIDDTSFYAAGDTSMTEDMKSGKLAALGLDYAVFCGDGYYNMDVEEASQCAALVDARHSIPVHLVPVHDPNGEIQLFDEKKAAAFHARGKIVLHPGETIELK